MVMFKLNLILFVMVPYYSLSNLFFYALSIILLGLIVPFMVYIKEYQTSKALILFLGFLAGFLIFWSLSKTCPYPAAEFLFFLLKILCSTGILFSGLFLIINRLRGNRFIYFTNAKAHNWIMETLNGNYIITSSSGQILSCGHTVLSPLEPYHDETLNSFLKRSSTLQETGTAENRKALESLYNEVLENKSPDGNIEISGRHYHWVYHQLGEHEVKGYLLFLTDLTNEQRLINQREETGRLLNLKNSWLRKQGRIAISLERSRLTEEISQKATKAITSHLITLSEDLHHLAESKTLDQKNLDGALGKSRKVMTRIRSAVHALPYRGGKETS